MRQDILKPNDNEKQELAFLAIATLCQILIAVLTSEAARNFGKRLTMLSRARWVPSTGAGDLNLIAALLDKSPETIEGTVRDRNLTQHKTGKECVYLFDELIVSSRLAKDESCTGVAQKKKVFRKHRGKPANK